MAIITLGGKNYDRMKQCLKSQDDLSNQWFSSLELSDETVLPFILPWWSRVAWDSVESVISCTGTMED